MQAFLTSLAIVVLAEMGDKTQLLAMAFAARIRWQTVMWGVFVATAANHLLAVLLGVYLTELCPLSYVKLAAAGSFVLFGLWTLRGDTLHGEDRRFKFSPFWTVAVAFFLAEIGDKTQLCTVALAAEFNTIVPVWLGTTTGMLIADAVGIIVGVVIHKRIPERLVKWLAALVFIGFGFWGLYENAPESWLTAPIVAATVAVVAALAVVVVWLNRRSAAKAPPAESPAAGPPDA